MEPTNAGRVGPAAPIAAAGAAAASADHPARRAPVGEVFTTPGSSRRHAFVQTPAPTSDAAASDSVDGHPSAWLVPSRPAGDSQSLLG